MPRRIFPALVLPLISLIWLSWAHAAQDAPERPNIVLIISDDHDNQHLGFMGNQFVHTPTLDGLARSGAVFTTAHLPMSRCHPTLASFLSGRWPHQTGIYYNYGEKKLAPENSLPNLLKAAGYASYAGGKYWEGDLAEMGFLAGNIDSRRFVRESQDELFQFIDQHAGQRPLFLWWAPMIPHTPHNPPQKYVDQYDWAKMPTPAWMQGKTLGPPLDARQDAPSKGPSTWRRKEQLSYAMEAWLDDGLRALNEKLQSVGQYENTLFVFVIDNGWCNGLVSKGSAFEKGVCTPVFLSSPARPDLVPPGQRFDGLVSTLDLYPTILDYAGVKVPREAAGQSLRPVVDGKSKEFRETLYGAIYPAFASEGAQRPEGDVYALYLRTRQWKYILWLQDVRQELNGKYFRIQSIETEFPTRDAGQFDLYDLTQDPYELHNLAAQPEHAELTARFRRQVLDWWRDTGGKPLKLAAGRYRAAVRQFADTVLQHGRDHYGQQQTPLFVDGLNAATLQPACWQFRGETWVLCNFASQQPLLRTLDGLTSLTGQPQYRQAAEEAAAYSLQHLASPNGLLYWGGHLAWDLQQDRKVGQYEATHEMKGHQPYYQLMWRVNPDATRRLLETIWASHILDWSSLDYNRHANTDKPCQPQWSHPFDENLAIPFPIEGNNLSFVNVTPSFLYAGSLLASLDHNQDALTWTRRLALRWRQARDPDTGLSGGQLSYRKQDRAQEALGHVHPQINEAKIVASYHQTSRYHHLPLAQMQAAENLREAGGAAAEVARELIQWASDDLQVYARRCYDPKQGVFVAMMTNGEPIRWRESREGYYVPESFAPQSPDGALMWGYALAYRLTGDPRHWQFLRQLLQQVGLGDLGDPDGRQRSLRSRADYDDWQTIYALLELHRATQDASLLDLACGIADNLLSQQAASGLFPRAGRQWARTGDEIPLAILHLAAALEGQSSVMPAPTFDRRFFHCEFHGELSEDQQKRADARTYDDMVYYGH